LTRELEEFKPQEDMKVKMYVCGPTVYDYSHIGHGRSYVAFDIIRRYLEYKGYKVKYVQNFTDVDDKIINRAKEMGVEPAKLAERFISEYFRDMDALGVKRADVYPRVTEHIKDIVEAVEKLVNKKHAYVVDGNVYFDITTVKDFGKLSHQSLENLQVGARVEIDERKRNPMDFALWKASKDGEPGWKSPWGLGRPGWHIECSVMSMKYLGETLDIHGGGMDLIFPHHENEIVQSEALTGKVPFARYWLHNGFINVNKEKMSKSLKNFFTIREVLEKFSPEAVRFFYANTHYRGPIDFSFEALTESAQALDRLQNAYENLLDYKNKLEKEGKSAGNGEGNEDKTLVQQFAQAIKTVEKRFEDAMDEDFNTREAIAALFDYTREVNRMLASGDLHDIKSIDDAINVYERLGNVLGILGKKRTVSDDEKIIESLMGLIIEIRQQARARKDFSTSDKIRDRLKEIGIVLEDTHEGVKWKRKSSV
ncbi:MAG: cysteine--tRNA ligase, partial [Thermoplasmata archaeon]